MTAALMEWETIDADQINDIMEGHPPRHPKVVAQQPKSSPDDPSGTAPNAAAPA